MRVATALGIASLASVFLYTALANSMVHSNRFARRIFWLVVACGMGVWLLPALDGIFSNVAYVIIISLLLASLLENSMRRTMDLVPFEAKAITTVKGTPEAEGKAALVKMLVDKMYRNMGSSIGLVQVVSILMGSMRQRRKIVYGVLHDATAAELNYILARVNCPQMMECSGQPFAKLLTSPAPDGRLLELDLLSRAVLIDAFQKIGLQGNDFHQKCVGSIVQHTFGVELTILKSYIDAGWGFHNCPKLFGKDLQGSLRTDVWRHVKMEGKKVRDTNSFTRKRGYALKIISDFDDTIVCSGATPKFAGCDNRLPRKAIYPGVLTLWKELDHCFTKSLRTSMIPVMNVSSEKEARASATILSVPAEADGARIPACQQAGSNIILLSARPRSYKGWSEAAFYSAVIKPLVKSGRLYCLPVLLMGSVGSILQAIVMYFTRQTLIPGFNGIKHIVYQMLGERKVQNFKAFSDCYPESSFLFFGDNGQGDVYFAEAVNSLQELESDEAEEHGRLFASFIHIVRPLAQTVSASCTQCGACEREHLLGSMLDADCHMHETHVAMATKCLSLQLIDEGSLARVIRDAINEFRFIMAKYPDQRDRWSRYARAMKRDVLEGLKAVSEDMRLGTDELKYLDVE